MPRPRRRCARAEAGVATAGANRAVIDAAERRGAGDDRRARGLSATRPQRDLDVTVIRAPFDGIVGNRAVAVGDLVAPGKRLLAVVPLAEVYVEANFKETQLAELAPRHEGARCTSTPSRTAASTAASRASPRRRARCSACCRRRTPPATSPRSCSACRSASPSPADGRRRGLAAPGPVGRGQRRHRATTAPDADRSRRAERRTPLLREDRPWRRRPPPPSRRSPPRRLIAFFAMVFGMFMAILDIQIVSASLAEIQAGLVGRRPTRSPGCRPAT